MADETDRLIAVYEPDPGYALPADFDLTKYAALQSVQVTRDEAGTCRLVTTWLKTPRTLEAALRLGQTGPGAPTWIQRITEEHPLPRPTLRSRLFRLNNLLLVIAALGAVEALRHHHAWLLTWPKYSVKPADADTHVLSGTPADIALKARNNASRGQLQVSLPGYAITGQADATASGDIEPDEEARYGTKAIPYGEHHEFPIRLPALSPGTHQLTLKPKGKAGLLWPAMSQPSTHSVRAWKKWELRPLTVDATGDNCHLWLELHVGAAYPQGATLHLQLEPAEGLHLQTTHFAELPGYASGPIISAGTGADSVIVQVIALPALKPFTVHKFWIRLKGNARPDAEWLALFSRIEPKTTLSQ